MLDYLPIFPDLMETMQDFDDATVGLLMRSMAEYAFSGTEPEFEKGSPARYAWPFLKRSIDSIQAKHAAKVAAGGRGGRPKQNKAEESTEKQTEAEETSENENGHTQRQTQTQTQTQTQSQDNEHTHGIQQTDDAGARAGEAPEKSPGALPGWYNPEYPDRPIDAACLTSDAARKAIAQRILDYVIREKHAVKCECWTAESTGRVIGKDILNALCAAMAGGVTPARCQRMGERLGTLWAWEIRLKEEALAAGTVPPDDRWEWQKAVEELRGEVEESLLYG